MLEVRDLTVSYGQVKAVKGISFTVESGQVVSLLGTNGAGKTTTLRALSGLIRANPGQTQTGTITLEGEPIHNLAAHTIVRRGLAHSPEGRRIFPRLTVEDNLRLGAYSRRDTAGIGKDLARVYALFDILAARRTQPAGTFSGGEQQMLAIGRALMSRPRLLMLDEPSMGLSPIMMQRIMTTVAELKAEGVTILLVEQNANAALRLADYGYVLEVGRITSADTGANLLNDDRVRKAYLGED
ncbi:MAG: ABC transporter ATP-binding protein [Propionibacteriaceae bacterium]